MFFFGEVSNGNKGHAVGNWRKGYPWYKVEENLTGVFSAVEWKVELLCDWLSYLAEETYKLSVGGTVQPGFSSLLIVNWEKK